MSFSPDGETVASASAGGTVKLWNFDLDDLLARSCDWLHDYLVNNPKVNPEQRALCPDAEAASESTHPSPLRGGELVTREDDIHLLGFGFGFAQPAKSPDPGEARAERSRSSVFSRWRCDVGDRPMGAQRQRLIWEKVSWEEAIAF